MSDSGAGPDVVVAAMFAVAVILGGLVLLPEGRLANAAGSVAAALVVLAVGGAAAIATMKASAYGDGTSHWHHMSQLLVVTGGAVSLASAAVLFSAHRVAVLRAGLATGSAGDADARDQPVSPTPHRADGIHGVRPRSFPELRRGVAPARIL